MLGKNAWWRPLLRLRAEHLAVVREEGLLVQLEDRALRYERAAQGAESVELARRFRRRAALLRTAKEALEDAATT